MVAAVVASRVGSIHTYEDVIPGFPELHLVVVSLLHQRLSVGYSGRLLLTTRTLYFKEMLFDYPMVVL
jgi:hypothetical protein